MKKITKENELKRQQKKKTERIVAHLLQYRQVYESECVINVGVKTKTNRSTEI